MAQDTMVSEKKTLEKSNKQSIMKKNLQRMLLVLMLGACTTMATFAQTGLKVTGKVIDKTTKETIVGAVVSVQGTAKSALSDAEGNYEIVVPDAQSTLEASYIGYKPGVVVVGSQSQINFELDINSLLLENVVVVGYGATKRSEITGSIATVKMDELPNLQQDQ